MDKYEHLKELKKLVDEGLITQEEFNAQKFNILNDAYTKHPDTTGNQNNAVPTNHNSKGAKKGIWYAIVGVLLVLIAIAYHFSGGFALRESQNTAKGPSPFVNVYFDDVEVFPVYLMYLRNTKQGVMELTLTNPATQSTTLQVTYGFKEFGGLESQAVVVEGGSVRKIQLAPFSNKLMEVFSPVNANLIVTVTDDQNKNIFSKSWALQVNPCDEIPWKIKNKDYTHLLASWVTPKNGAIEELMGKVKAEIGNGIQVDKMSDEDFRQLVKAIFNTVRKERVAYINSTISFSEGYTQRIRLPYLTLKTKSANCIDASVLLASLFENVGLRPYIIILPEHAIVGVARPYQENDKIFIETTMLGRSTLESILSLEPAFTTATRSGKEAYNNAYSKYVNQESGRFAVIDVHKARQEGILPIN